MQKLKLKNLKLTNYRNFSSYKTDFSANIIVFIGSNGIGKTNILEAISLFSPTKGLRNSKAEELENQNNSLLLGWNITIDFSLDDLDHQFISSKDPQKKSRNLLINKEVLKKQQDAIKYANLLWLTPIYDSIFIAEKSIRRKFFDRMVFNLFPEHLNDLMKYDYYLRERINILKNNQKYDEIWLTQIEKKLAELNSSIANSRVLMIKYLNAELLNNQANYPQAFLSFSGVFEEMYLQHKTAQEIEHEAIKMLRENRLLDAEKGKTYIGCHKTDFLASFEAKNIMAKLCSTGEQKSLLISIIYAKVKLLKKIANRTPILLLDEILSHLDDQNANNFINDLAKLEIQVFITSTNLEFFQKIAKVQIIEIN